MNAARHLAAPSASPAPIGARTHAAFTRTGCVECVIALDDADLPFLLAAAAKRKAAGQKVAATKITADEAAFYQGALDAVSAQCEIILGTLSARFNVDLNTARWIVNVERESARAPKIAALLRAYDDAFAAFDTIPFRA